MSHNQPVQWNVKMAQATGREFPIQHAKAERNTLLTPTTAAFIKAQLR